MSTTERLLIELPIEQAQEIRARVANGEYANESELISDALAHDASPHEGDLAFEHWLRTDILDSIEQLHKHPETAITSEQFLAKLEHEKNNW